MELPENLWEKKFSLIDRCHENTNHFLASVSHVSPGPLLLLQCGKKEVWLRLWSCFFQWKFMLRLEIPKWYNICHYIQIILFVSLRLYHYSFHQSEGSKVQECNLNISFMWNKLVCIGILYHFSGKTTNWNSNAFSLKYSFSISHIFITVIDMWPRRDVEWKLTQASRDFICNEDS